MSALNKCKCKHYVQQVYNRYLKIKQTEQSARKYTLNLWSHLIVAYRRTEGTRAFIHAWTASWCLIRMITLYSRYIYCVISQLCLQIKGLCIKQGHSDKNCANLEVKINVRVTLTVDSKAENMTCCQQRHIHTTSFWHSPLKSHCFLFYLRQMFTLSKHANHLEVIAVLTQDWCSSFSSLLLT